MNLTREEVMELINALCELDEEVDDDIYDEDDDEDDDIYDEVPTMVNLGNGMGMICIMCDDDEIGAELAHHALRTLEQLCK